MPSRRFTILAAAGLIGFLIILVMVELGDGIVRFDDYVSVTIYHTHGWFSRFSTDMVDTVSPTDDGIVLLLVATFLCLRLKSLRPLLAALWAEGITLVIVLNLKYAIDRDVPGNYPTIKGEFPSGHTASALILLGTAVLLLWQGRRRQIGLTVVLAITLLLATCLIWNRMHWFSDVLASFLLAPGLLWWISLTPSFRATVKRRASDPRSLS